MSATPSATPEALAPLYDSPFNSTTLIITVGHECIPFSVHQAKLAQTAFFEVHEPLAIEAKGPPQANVNVFGDTHVKSEDGTVRIRYMGHADYHVEDRFFLSRAAFDVFVKHLYNEHPVKPTKIEQVKTLYQVYGIARLYKCYSLQNRVIDCLRAYYSRIHVKLDDLIWAVNRFGDNVKCPLNKYLVEQVAFDIATRSLAEFAGGNVFTQPFLIQGDRAIRSCLFEALAHHAQGTTSADPANGKHQFHVDEKTGEPKL